MATAKYLKLGAQASSFSDPSTGLKMNKKSLVLETDSVKKSKRVQRAKKHGWLEYAEDEEIKAAEEAKANPENAKEGAGKIEVVFDEDFLMKKTKDELYSTAVSLIEEEDDEDEKSLGKMNKQELVDFIMSKEEEDEEEED